MSLPGQFLLLADQPAIDGRRDKPRKAAPGEAGQTADLGQQGHKGVPDAAEEHERQPHQARSVYWRPMRGPSPVSTS